MPGVRSGEGQATRAADTERERGRYVGPGGATSVVGRCAPPAPPAAEKPPHQPTRSLREPSRLLPGGVPPPLSPKGAVACPLAAAAAAPRRNERKAGGLCSYCGGVLGVRAERVGPGTRTRPRQRSLMASGMAPAWCWQAAPAGHGVTYRRRRGMQPRAAASRACSALRCGRCSQPARWRRAAPGAVRGWPSRGRGYVQLACTPVSRPWTAGLVGVQALAPSR